MENPNEKHKEVDTVKCILTCHVPVRLVTEKFHCITISFTVDSIELS